MFLHQISDEKISSSKKSAERKAAEAVVKAALICCGEEGRISDAHREELIQAVLADPTKTKDLFEGRLFAHIN